MPAPAAGPARPGGLLLRLLARDPGCVFAFWEVAPEGGSRLAEATVAGRIRLRLLGPEPDRALLVEQTLPSGARSAFLEIGTGVPTCVAELVWIRPDGTAETLTQSAPLRLSVPPPPKPTPPHINPPDPVPEPQCGIHAAPTPAATPSEPTHHTVAVDQFSAAQPQSPAPAKPTSTAPPAESGTTARVPQPPSAVFRMTGPQSVPDAPPASIPDAAALAEAVALAMQFGIPAGLFPGRGETPSSPSDNGIPRPDSAVGPGLLPASADAAPPGGPVSSAELTASVGDSGTAGPRGFWFNVNAELIVYGATAPDARLTVDGQPMALRPDGTFTLRFALPDGSYGLELQATAADANEDRTARLRFLRGTRTGGRVGIQPPAQDLPSPPEA